MFWLSRKFLPPLGYSWEGLRVGLGEKEISRSQQESETLVTKDEKSLFQKLEWVLPTRFSCCRPVTTNCSDRGMNTL